MHRKSLATWILLLFLVSTISPVVFGINVDESEDTTYLDDYYLATYDPLKDHPQKQMDYTRTIQMYQAVDELNRYFVPPTIISIGGPIDSAWPMQSHDQNHSGLSPYDTASNPGVEKWRYKTRGSVESGIAIDIDGTLYFGDFSGWLYALNPDGSLKWEHEAMAHITLEMPCIANNGIIYIGSHARLQAWDRNGTQQWSIGVGGNIGSSPAIADDGTIYVGHMNNDMCAVYPNGTIKWKYTTGSWIACDPTIHPDGTIIFGSSDTYIYALYPNGMLRWRYKTGEIVRGHASIDDQGVIYMSCWDGYLYAFYVNGTLKKKFDMPIAGGETMAFGPDGTIYVTYDGLAAIDPSDWNVKWKYDYPGENEKAYLSSPAVSADGIICIGVDVTDEPLGAIYAINPDGTLRWRKYIADQGLYSSPTIAEDGTVYIGSWWLHGGSVHAFNEWIGTNHPPEKPTYRIIHKPNILSPYFRVDFTAVDPDLHPLKIVVDWDDISLIEETLEIASSYPYTFEHQYHIRLFKTFNVRAKAVDSFGMESDWTVIPISLPVSFQYPGIQWMLERFTLLSQLLNLLRGLE